ncbi:male accessory gland serine protease inhibitor-like [Drosophila ananassae]|uniref:male accessory gland serine protease inhibitor-like n=1 Tax=Drosophila ananassae TaxID=7217 RepID=UPI000177DA9B|nr:male accessory gland serine protease inhibitor-like [Drosophila ananassae]
MKLYIFFSVFAAFLAISCALKDEICGQPHSLNGDGRISCEAYFPNYSYDSAKKECVFFVYGGCGGNENRFVSKEACEEKCLE